MSSTKKILSAVISLTAAAAVITAVRYAVSDKNAEYTFSGFYFDTAVTCKTVSSDGSLSEAAKVSFRSWTKSPPHMMKIPQFIR